jgi:thymidylate synthase
MFLGVPFNIASYAMLTYMIAHVCGMNPRRLVLNFGDAHIYESHIEQVKKQLTRTPAPFPLLEFRKPTNLQEIDDFTFDSFVVKNYVSWPPIKADMVV